MSSSFQQCSGLTTQEQICVQAYAGNLYKPLNNYLINTDNMQVYKRINPQELIQNLYYFIANRNELNANGILKSSAEKRIIKLIKSMSASANITWFRNIMFKFTMLLYGTILKCPKQHQEIVVYRGTLTHYLKEDKNRRSFLNTFTSTSIDRHVAESFTHSNNNNAILYHFIVMPDVSCIYIEDNEAELLLNPYQYYSFVRKEGINYIYTIFPSNSIPPNNENEFSEFKRNMITRTVGMNGGDAELHINVPELHMNIPKHNKIIRNYKNTRRAKKINNNTKKNKKEKALTAYERFRERMNMPIGSSSISFPLTPEMIAINERIAKEYKF